MRQQGGIKGKKVFVFPERMGNAHSTAKLPELADSELLSGQASRVKNPAEYFCVSKWSAISRKGGKNRFPVQLLQQLTVYTAHPALGHAWPPPHLS